MELIELGKTPINQDNPAGIDVRYEPEFEALQREIDKLTSPTSEEGINWDKVVNLSTAILKEKSKDLLVASYLSVALIRTTGLEGVETGFIIYRDLLENFWEFLFPSKKRMRGRINAIGWWRESTIASIRSLQPESPMPDDQLQRISGILDAINSFVTETVEDAPSLNQLQECIGNLQRKSESAETDQRETTVVHDPDTVSAPEAVPSVKGDESVAAISDQDPDKVFASGLDMLRQAATLFARKDISNAMSYRLARLAAWLPVKILPPAQDGRTRIPPPLKEIRGALKTLYQQNEYKALLESAESRIGEFLFWLDLSHYAAVALENLNYEKALRVVNVDTALYVRRLPGIEKLSFSDGTPFADEETTEWLQEISISNAVDAEGTFLAARSSFESSEESEISDIYGEAEALVKKKKVADGVQLIQERLSTGTSQKSRFLWRVALIRLLVNAKKTRLALPHLWEILHDIEVHNLDNWDPDLVLRALTEVHKTLRTQTDKSLQERAEEAMDHISKLNPVAALRLTK